MIGIGLPNTLGCVSANVPDDGNTSGRQVSGMPNRFNESSSQVSPCMSRNMVRLALDTSVKCGTWPAVLPEASRHSWSISQASTFPNAISPRSARFLISWSAKLSSIHSIFVAEKYGSMTRPVVDQTLGPWPASTSSPHLWAVRLSCHTIALAMGVPVRRSQATVVSRWTAIPMAAIDSLLPGARATASRATPMVASAISVGSCSTQPGRG